MSKIAARELVKMGYKNIYNLEGGTINWEKKRYPFESSKEK
jgi:rhodanese-related sulfurtransferase